MKKQPKKKIQESDTNSQQVSPAPSRGGSFFRFVLGCLVAMTLFFSGEQNDRFGMAHLPGVLWLLAAAVWFLAPLLTRRSLPPVRWTRTDLGVYAFFGLAVLSILWNLLPGRDGAPRPGFNMLSVWILLATAWFLFRQTLHEHRVLSAVLLVVIGTLMAESLVGLHQQFVEIPRMIRQFEANPAGVMALADPTIEPGTPNWIRMESRLRTAAPMGTFPMSNTLGGLLAVGLVFLAGLFLLRKADRAPETPPETKKAGLTTDRAAVLVVLTFCLFLCFVLTKCRSGYVALAVGLVFLAVAFFRSRSGRKILSRRRLYATLLLPVALAGTAFLFVPGSGKTLLAGAERSLGYRLEYWLASLEMIRDEPILGCGGGNFKATYMKYKLPGASEEISDPHNFIMETAATMGLPALILLLAVLAWVLLGRFQRPADVSDTSAADASGPARELFLGGLFGCWVAFVLSFASEAPMDITAPLAATLVFAALIYVFPRTQPFPIPRAAVAITLFALLVHLLAAGGFSVSNTALLLWLLAAALTAPENAREIGPVKVRALLAAIPILCLAGVYCFGLRPVLFSQALVLRAQSVAAPANRVRLLGQAVREDPWSYLIRDLYAMELLRFWAEAPNNEQAKQSFLDAQEQVIRLNGRSGPLRFTFAERLNLILSQPGLSEGEPLRERMLNLYAEAIERYPNQSRFHAAYALALWQAGRRPEAQDERDTALELDDTMEHLDQKLSQEQREKLEALGPTGLDPF